MADLLADVIGKINDAALHATVVQEIIADDYLSKEHIAAVLDAEEAKWPDKGLDEDFTRRGAFGSIRAALRLQDATNGQ